MTHDPRFLVVHALRVRGLASRDDLVEITGVAEPDAVLEQLVAADLVKLRSGRVAGYALTKAGREAHAGLLADAVDDAERAATEQTYAAFLPLNAQFKDLCTRWQRRDGGDEPNDHTDPDHDAAVIGDLATTHRGILAALEPAGAVSSRLARYGARFGAALDRVRAGDHAAFARPMSASYHDVWMELHEDLLLTLGRERSATDGH